MGAHLHKVDRQLAPEDTVHVPHRGRADDTMTDVGLIRHNHEQISSAFQALQGRLGLRIELEIL
jgi:hypothetical protein